MNTNLVTLIPLLGLLIAAVVTDVRWQKIYNWNTYPGIVLAFALRGATEGLPGLEDAFKGFLTCGVVMLICFVLFGLGGGDLKLLAMTGAFLGFEKGVESLLWTVVLGGLFGAIRLVWQLGAWRIGTGTIQQLGRIWGAKGWVPLEAELQKPLKQTLFLAPAALLAVLIVTASSWLKFSG